MPMVLASTHFVLAWWHHQGHHWWIWMLTWLLLVGIAVALLWPRLRGPRPERSAEAVLAERYARGEIGADEYGERLDILRRHHKA